jgi:hypothetical protein
MVPFKETNGTAESVSILNKTATECFTWQFKGFQNQCFRNHITDPQK